MQWKRREGLALLKRNKGRDPNRYAFGSLRKQILDRDGYMCRYCEEPLTDVTAMIDHVLPWHLGGATHPGNLVTCCSLCNASKLGSTEVAEEIFNCETPEEADAVLEYFGKLWNDEWLDGQDLRMADHYDFMLLDSFEYRLRSPY